MCEDATKGRPLGRSLTQLVLLSPDGIGIRLRASLGFLPLKCTKHGGRCACKSTCFGFLQLKPAHSGWIGGSRNAPTFLLGPPIGSKEVLPKDVVDQYLSPEGPLICTGDEASLCCPFELSHKSLKAEVVVTGGFKKIMINGRQMPLLEVGDICRVPD